jgi:predicted dinucleotide-binding enzyme
MAFYTTGNSADVKWDGTSAVIFTSGLAYVSAIGCLASAAAPPAAVATAAIVFVALPVAAVAGLAYTGVSLLLRQ